MMKSNSLFRLLTPYLLFICCDLQIARAAITEDPVNMLRNGVDEVLSIAYSGQSSERLAAQVKPLLQRHFDFELLTRQAIGPGWRQFSPAEQKRVTDLFTDLMIRNYSARVVGTKRPKITYGKASTLAADRCEIPTRAIAPDSDQPVTVVYRLIRRADGWRVYDVLVEGVSFVSNYRAQFDDIVQHGGASAVIRTLESKLAAPPPPRS
ncbi:MAG: ABC transporter substrate-binding protein [Verrucomicrobia bacterium]|nr:ABC transporter substrate-binding protein [Verrucomicrobiota bacterium]MBV9671553.1 ABC transporter substrate-binding protein [Verrucomicrobiota bacterium]